MLRIAEGRLTFYSILSRAASRLEAVKCDGMAGLSVPQD